MLIIILNCMWNQWIIIMLYNYSILWTCFGFVNECFCWALWTSIMCFHRVVGIDGWEEVKSFSPAMVEIQRFWSDGTPIYKIIYNVIISIVANVFSPIRCTTYFAYRDQGCVHIKINTMYKPGPPQCTKLLITLAATCVQ